MKPITSVSFIIILGILLISIGWFSNDLYQDVKYRRDYDGLFLKAREQENAIQITQQFDKLGDWVCINSRGMNYDECVITSQHECGHEVFAEIIEKNPEKIKEVMGVLGK